MTLLSRIFTLPQYQSRLLIASQALVPSEPYELYRLLRLYYECNGLYEALAQGLYEQGIWSEALKPLRNPTYRVVEFHASHLWPGILPDALPIETDNERLLEPIHQVWDWSNWGSNKQVFARWLPMLGDVFLKVVQREDRSRVYFQLLDPSHVTDFDTDERDFLTWIRIDVPKVRREGEKLKPYTYTEVWDKAAGTFNVWEHTKGRSASLEQLPTPVRSERLASFGFNFIPLVHVKFRDTGDKRGVAAILPALDKIDEANRMATRLHQMLFRHNRPHWALSANALDASGRPLPAPRIGSSLSGDGSAGDTITLGDDRLLRLPGMSKLESLVPSLHYEAALAILQDHLHEIEKDLPELAYYRIREMQQVSGKAVRLLLSDAIDRALEVRGNAEAALVRADAMALTLGANAGLFQDLGGTFEDGAFAHTFAKRDVLPSDELEDAQAAKADAEAKLVRQQLGVSKLQTLRELGYTDDQIVQMAQEQEATSAQLGEEMLRTFDKGQ